MLLCVNFRCSNAVKMFWVLWWQRSYSALKASCYGWFVTEWYKKTLPSHHLQCESLELRLEEDRVFTEYEQVPKKRADCLLTTATLPENAERNRFRDVVPYEENRVELVPNKENNTGYINASHIKVRSEKEKWFQWRLQCFIIFTYFK